MTPSNPFEDAQKQEEEKQKQTSDAFSKHRKNLASRGLQPNLRRENLIQYIPASFYQSLEQQAPGMPDPASTDPLGDWDYKSPPTDRQGQALGPKGETLPPGAVGWDAFGQPYYGGSSPLDEWWKKTTTSDYAYLYADVSEKTTKQIREEMYGSWEYARLQVQQGKPLGERIVGGLTNALGNAMTYLTEYFPKLLSGTGEGETSILDAEEIKSSDASAGEKTRSVLTAASRSIGHIIVGAGLALDAITARPVKKWMSKQAGKEELLEEEGVDASNAGIGDDIGEYLRQWAEEKEEGFVKSVTEWTAGLFENVRPIAWAQNSLKIKDLGLGKDTVKERLELDKEAGAVFYSSFIDAAVREEFKRRRLAGEDPYLLEMELMNPLAEVAGELIFDPLNLVGLFTKPAKSARTANLAENLIGRATKAGDVITEVDKLTDATRAGTRTEDLADLSKAVQKGVEELRGTVSDPGVLRKRKKGIFGLTPQGERDHIERLGQHILYNDMRHVNGNPDDWWELVKARAMLASSNEADVAEAIAKLRSSGIHYNDFLSEGSLRYSSVMREMLFDDAGKFNTKRWEKIVSMEKLDDALVEMDKLQEVAMQKMFPDYAEVKPGSLSAMLEKTRRGKNIYGKLNNGVNRVASNVWMGLSPGFVARNYMQNKLHVLADTGVKGFLGSLFRNNMGVLEKVYGTVDDIPPFMTKGWGITGTISGSRKIGKDASTIKLRDWIWGNLKRSGIVEARERAAVSAHVINRTWKKSRGIVLDPTTLRKMGVPEAGISQVIRVLDDNMGDINKAMPLINELLAGEADLIKSMTWMNNETADLFRTHGMYEELVDGIRMAETQEEQLDFIAEMSENLSKYIDEAAQKEAYGVYTGGSAGGLPQELIDDFDKFDKYVSDPKVGQMYRKSKISNMNYQQSQAIAIEGMRTSFINQIDNLKIEGVTGQAVWDDMVKQSPIYQSLIDDTYVIDLVDPKQNEILNTSKKYIDALRADGAGQDEIAAAYGVFKQMGLLDDPIPANVNPKEVATYLYEAVWWPQQRSAYAIARDEMAAIHKGMEADVMARYMDIVEKAKLDEFEDLAELIRPKSQQAAKDLHQSQKLDNAIMTADGKIVQLTPEAGANFDAVQRLAFANRTSVRTVRGGDEVVGTHLLNIVKKYTGNAYDDVTQIPFDVAEEAFKLRSAAKIEETGDDAWKFVKVTENLPRKVTDPGPVGFGKKLDKIGEHIDDLDAFEDAAEWQKQLDVLMEDAGLGKGGREEYFRAVEDFKNGVVPEGVKAESVIEGAGETIPGAAKVDSRTGESVSDWVGLSHAERKLKEELQTVTETIQRDYGKIADVPGGEFGPDIEKWMKNEVAEKAYSFRNVATEVAKQVGDFALHNYGSERNLDLLMSLIYPYQFWYSRSYAKWIERIVRQPGILRKYVSMKEALGKMHSDLPDYFKYQINTNEIFGLDSENPLFFNLEATLNPLNAITGVDFNDPKKRVDAWTTMLDGMNRFGPSIAPMLQFGTAGLLMAQGEDEAAQHWGTRFSSLTSYINALGAYAGNDFLATTEFDPATLLFGKGEDPWLTPKIGKAAYAMMQEADDGKLPYTKEEIFDAMRAGEGPIFDEAKKRAIQNRPGLGYLSSYLFGVGFKPRTQQDIATEDMYNELFSILSQRDNYSNSEFRLMMTQLNNRYPDMDTVMMMKKFGEERDTVYAWSVMGRIPPGDSYDTYQSVGLDQRLVDKFYNSKGNLADWEEKDRQQFMDAMLDISAILAIPDGTTELEWTKAKVTYNGMMTSMETLFGESINDKIDYFWVLKNGGGDVDKYMLEHPEVGMALDFKAGAIVNGPPEMQAYYSGLNKIENYYKGLLYNQAENTFGSQIWNTQNTYWEIRETKGEADAKKYLREHPELKEYWDLKNKSMDEINSQIISVASQLPEGTPAQIREDIPAYQDMTEGQQSLYRGLTEPETPWTGFTPDMWGLYLGQDIVELALASLQRELTYDERQTLDQAAGMIGDDRDKLIQYIGLSMSP